MTDLSLRIEWPYHQNTSLLPFIKTSYINSNLHFHVHFAFCFLFETTHFKAVLLDGQKLYLNKDEMKGKVRPPT